MCSCDDAEACTMLFEAHKFRQVAELISFDEDNDLAVFRKFKWLNICVLLYQQNQLIALEEELKGCESKKAMCGTLSRAGPLLQDYSILSALLLMLKIGTCVTDTVIPGLDKALLQQVQIFGRQKPPSHLTELLVDQSNKSRHELKSFINVETIHDLVSLDSTLKGPIHNFIDKTAFLRHLFLKRRKPNQPRGLEIYYKRHVKRLEKVCINLTFGVLVLVPIGVLPYIASVKNKILIIASATLVASFLVGGVLTEYHRSNLTLMVGYTAILVVFLGNTIQ